MKKKALIFGVTGQDGSYLAENLLEKNYEVHGLIRRSATGNTKNIDHILKDIVVHQGDLDDATSLYRAINQSGALEIYNEADQDHVGWSYDSVGYSCDITGKAVGVILEIIKQINPNEIKYFQPLTSHMFGKTKTMIQNEDEAFYPQSPYAAAKVMAYSLVRYYRDAFNIHASSAFFYNHTSERKNDDYAINKIVNSAIRISKGLQDKLELGPIDIEVDYGFAPEYMEAAWNIMQLDTPSDFIVASSNPISLRDALKYSFSYFNLNYEDYVTYNKKFERPSDNGRLCGDITKAKETFGFDPKITGEKLVDQLIADGLKKYS